MEVVLPIFEAPNLRHVNVITLDTDGNEVSKVVLEKTKLDGIVQ